jgi:hypothetical protein
MAPLDQTHALPLMPLHRHPCSVRASIGWILPRCLPIASPPFSVAVYFQTHTCIPFSKMHSKWNRNWAFQSLLCQTPSFKCTRLFRERYIEPQSSAAVVPYLTCSAARISGERRRWRYQSGERDASVHSCLVSSTHARDWRQSLYAAIVRERFIPA